jgi:hypothetical protein
MSLASGCISPKELVGALVLTASKQADESRRLPSGGIIPPGAIPDHVNFDGAPIFYPGTYDPATQGGEPWGILPAFDDQFYFIEMAREYLNKTGDASVLHRKIQWKPLHHRLEEAFRVPPRADATGLVRCSEENRGVSFGFTDIVYHTGDLLFSSLLACRAARHLAELFEYMEDNEKVASYGELHNELRRSISSTFAGPDGYLKASTGASAQPDVWGTAFAVYENLLTPEAATKAAEAILIGYRKSAIAWRGSIRHVPTTHDYSRSTSWEKTAGSALNTYQNGAYWSTPTGWVAYTLARCDVRAARELMQQFIADLQEGDFRKGKDFGAPWECMHPAGNYRQNPVYLTSVSCPVVAMERVMEAK